MTIIGLLEQVKNNEIVLPAIQRSFVWDENKIEKLMDSVMRGYPIGMIMLWETYNDIQYRTFTPDYRQTILYTFHDNSRQKRLKLVLDGQQRLQSLYTALYGTYIGKHLYFDVLTGRETEDFKEDKYIFRFLTHEEATRSNEKAISDKSPNIQTEEREAYYWYKLKDLLDMGVRETQELKRSLSKKLALSENDEIRLDQNLSLLRNALSSEQSIVRETVLDQDKTRESPDRKSESDVLEAFVRINREGTPLSRSDLIFSMLKLNWKESATTLPEFVQKVNVGNSFEIDSDFVIRCLFAVSNLGTRFDIDILRKKSNITEIQANFEECCNAIRSVVDFVQAHCWLASSRLLGGYYNLVPLVYYLFHAPNHQPPNSEIDTCRKAIYLFGFTSPFSRYADSRLGRLIRDEFKPLADKGIVGFPLKECVSRVQYWEEIAGYGPQMLQRNPSLALHVVQRRSGAKIHYEKNEPQIDHIFPESILRQKRFEESEIDHFANFWILAKNKNQNKSNKDPKDYFADVGDSLLEQAYIDRDLLEYRSYRRFLKKREKVILDHVRRELRLTDADFSV